MTGDDTAEPTPWQDLTPEQKQTVVRELVEHRHKTYGQAALLLGVRRNVIAGVVERSKRSASPIVSQSGRSNGDIKRRRPNGVKPARKAKPKAATPPKKPRHAGFHQFVALALPSVVVVERAPPSAVWEPLPGIVPVSIEDHREGQCRWIHGGEPGHPWMYCGAPVKGAGVYCSQHAAIAYREPPTVKHRTPNDPRP